MPSDDPNVGIAIGLVCFAGAATGVGGSVVFVPSLVRYASRRTLASALGLSAGVMVYVSFTEIFQKSNEHFQDAGLDENHAYIFATLCFFGGVVAMWALNHIVSALLGGGHHHHDDHVTQGAVNNRSATHVDDESLDSPAAGKVRDARKDPGPPLQQQQQEINPSMPCCSDNNDAVRTLESCQKMAEEIGEFEAHGENLWQGVQRQGTQPEAETTTVAAAATTSEPLAEGAQSSNNSAVETTTGENHDSQKLMRMSLNTALAIGLHNFPEGLATFVATLGDPKVGLVLAVAIAIHNIPEGLCVAMPVYYATGNRLKAFSWALLSGVAEPLAALLGWAALANSFSDRLYAILFGIVGGMMVMISARELLPTAHRYDPDDTVVTNSFMIGMAIMAASLVLFLI